MAGAPASEQMAASPGRVLTIWTIGHSTRSSEEILALLGRAQIEEVLDVRSYPGSRRNPQFGSAAMRHWLQSAGISYTHSPDLGGRRPKQNVDAALNSGWRNASFRNYADWSLSEAFGRALDDLLERARVRRIAVMCSETLPWRCHRSLIASALAFARGVAVRHIVSAETVLEHELGSWGPEPQVRDGVVTYPGAVLPSLFELP